MRTCIYKPKVTQQTKTTESTKLSRSLSRQNLNGYSSLQLQRTIGNQAAQQFAKSNASDLQAGLSTIASTRFADDFSRIPIFSPSPVQVQPKLTIGVPGDIYEQEAARVADQVMRMPEPHLKHTVDYSGECPTRQVEQPIYNDRFVQRKHASANDAQRTEVPRIVNEVINSGGQPLDSATTAFFEPRFRHDFNHVRVHIDTRAAESAKALDARAFTVGSNIIFGSGAYEPETSRGRTLIAHELTHVVQQNQMAVPHIQRQENKEKDSRFKRVPPGAGAYTEDEYKEWRRLHPDHAFSLGGPWESKAFYARYTPAWFLFRGYFYSGSMYGGYQGARFEIWLSNEGKGKEFRIFRDVTSKKSSKPDNKTREPENEVKTDCDETEALEEMRIYAEDYPNDQVALVSRAEELKDLATRTSPSSDEYIELYNQFQEAIERFNQKYEFILDKRILELWTCVTSRNSVAKMGKYNDILNDFHDFDPYDDVVPGISIGDPIDFSGEP